MQNIYFIDFLILDFIQSFLKSFVLDPVMQMLSYIGEAGAIWLLAAFIMLFFRKSRPCAVMLLTSLVLALLIGELGLKNIICRPRPFMVNRDIVLNIKDPTGYSFPSGHSSCAFASAYVIARTLKSKAAGIGAYILACLIAFSRLYNYVHFPTDVLGGIILGTLCAMATVFVFRKTGLDKKLDREIRIGKKRF